MTWNLCSFPWKLDTFVFWNNGLLEMGFFTNQFSSWNSWILRFLKETAQARDFKSTSQCCREFHRGIKRWKICADTWRTRNCKILKQIMAANNRIWDHFVSVCMTCLLLLYEICRNKNILHRIFCHEYSSKNIPWFQVLQPSRTGSQLPKSPHLLRMCEPLRDHFGPVFL